MKIKILTPVYNDWDSVIKLLDKINLEVAKLKDEFSVIILNDASTESLPKIETNYKNIFS